MTENPQWEVSILAMHDARGWKYKVTRRLPRFFIAETRIMRDKKKAQELFEHWLQESA